MELYIDDILIHVPNIKTLRSRIQAFLQIIREKNLRLKKVKCILKENEVKFVEREMFYLTTHSTHFIYGYMASDIWLRTILIVRKETRCRHIGYSYRLTARVEISGILIR